MAPSMLVVFLIWSLFLFPLGVSSSVSPFLPRVSQADKCPVVLKPQPPESTTRIVGGQPSGSQTASFMAYITDGLLACSGILVAPTIVVFGAHCSVNQTWLVYIGAKTQRNENALIRQIDNVETHPSFKPNDFSHSLSFITLQSSVSNVPVAVSSDTDIPRPGSFVRHVGYGYLDENNDVPNRDGTLHQVDVPIYTPQDCVSAYSDQKDSSVLSDQGLFCSGYPGGGCGGWYVINLSLYRCSTFQMSLFLHTPYCILSLSIF